MPNIHVTNSYWLVFITCRTAFPIPRLHLQTSLPPSSLIQVCCMLPFFARYYYIIRILLTILNVPWRNMCGHFPCRMYKQSLFCSSANSRSSCQLGTGMLVDSAWHACEHTWIPVDKPYMQSCACFRLVNASPASAWPISTSNTRAWSTLVSLTLCGWYTDWQAPLMPNTTWVACTCKKETGSRQKFALPRCCPFVLLTDMYNPHVCVFGSYT